MPSTSVRFAAVAVAVFAPCVLAAQTSLDVGLGIVIRGTDPSSITFPVIPGVSGELGLSRPISGRTRLRVDVGGQFFGEAVAMPDCIPGGDCRTQRSLTRETHATVALERALFARTSALRVFAGAGAYWTGTEGHDVGDGRRSAAAPGVNAGASIGLGRIRGEGRLHVPIGDLAEVRLMATLLLRIPLVTK